VQDDESLSKELSVPAFESTEAPELSDSIPLSNMKVR